MVTETFTNAVKMNKDKREHIRYKIVLVPLRCSKAGHEDVNIDITDISYGGLGIVTDEKLDKTDSIDLEISLPGDNVPMFVTGEVVWISQDPDTDDAYKAGVKLTRISHADRKRLVRHLGSSFVQPE
ncbi:PilZ domain-containing protein [Candidatus Omnitrophota bacterium]